MALNGKGGLSMILLDFEERPKLVEFEVFKPAVDITEQETIAKPNLEVINDLSKFYDQKIIESDKDLSDLYELLSQVKSKISINQTTEVLRQLEIALDGLHAFMNLWHVAKRIQDMRLWEGFLSCYLSLCEKFTSVFSDSTLAISNPKGFWTKCFNDVTESDLDISVQARIKLLHRYVSCGFQDEFAQMLVPHKALAVFIEVFALKSDHLKVNKLLQLLLNAAHIRYPELEFVGWIKRTIIPFYSKSSFVAFFDDVLRYNGINLHSFVILLAVLCWHYADIDMRKRLKVLMNKKLKPSKYAAHVFIAIFCFCSVDDLTNDSEFVQAFLEHISSRINHAEHDVRIEGMVLAEMYAALCPTDKPLYFDLDQDVAEVEEYRRTQLLIRQVDQWITPGQRFVPYKHEKPILDAGFVENVEDMAHVKTIESKKIIDLSTLPTIEPRNSKIRRPKFIRDCAEYLRSDDPDKWEIALSELPTTIKIAFKLELKEFGPPLFKTILFMSNQYSLKDFDQQRVAIMSQLMDSLPESCLWALKTEFVGNHLNIGQKAEVINLVVTKIRELGCIENGSPIEHIKELFSLLRFVDKFETTTGSSPFFLPTILKHFYLPLLSEMQTMKSKVFVTAHSFFLERFLLSLAILLNAASNSFDYHTLVRPVLRFIQPVYSDPEVSGPIIRASIYALESMVACWPSGLEISPYLDDFGQISNWITYTLSQANDDIQMLAYRLHQTINKKFSVSSIIKEYSSDRSLDFEQISIVK